MYSFGNWTSLLPRLRAAKKPTQEKRRLEERDIFAALCKTCYTPFRLAQLFSAGGLILTMNLT